MILFYRNDTGDIFATVDGRVHDETHLNVNINPGLQEEIIGKFIIGWIEKNGIRIPFNIDKLSLLQEFESLSPVSPLDFRIDVGTGELMKKADLVGQKQSSDEEHPQENAPINE